MSNINELLLTEFEALKNEIITAYNDSGMNASGNWASTVMLELEDDSITLTADDYLNGRGPGGQPPSDVIEAWIRDKGIANQMESELTVESLAFLIARKIGREGWQPKPGAEFVVESIATPARIMQILDRVGDIQLEDFTNDLISYLKAAGI